MPERPAIALPKLGLGTAPLGGLYSPVDDDQARQALVTAFDAGLRLWDTAPHYGAGLAESRVGDALKLVDRKEIVLSTKVGRLLREGRAESMFVGTPDAHAEFDFSRRGVRRSVEESCERLGVDHLDLVHIHDPDDHFELARDESLPELLALRDEGVIGAVGVGMNQVEMLVRFAEIGAFDCLFVAGRYTLLDQSAARELLPTCHERGISVLVGGVFNSGILAEVKDGAYYDYAPAPQAIVERARQIEEICVRHGVPLRAAAIQFPLRHPVVTTVVVGARSADEVRDAMVMSDWPLPEAMWDELAAEGVT